MSLWFTKSRLKRALERGLATGNLEEEVRDLGEFALKTRADAEALFWGLQQLKPASPSLAQDTYRLAVLFQKVADGECDAIPVLREYGIPELLRLYAEIEKSVPQEDNADTLLFILKILAMYGTTDGVLKVIDAARQPLKPDAYLWSIILGVFGADHPQNDLLYDSLRDPLPHGFIAISLLDAANRALVDGAQITHPFDSGEGIERLRQWLTNSDLEDYSYAYSATAALPFINNSQREELLRIASEHPDVGVRIEAAWASAKLGLADGLQQLADHCLDLKHSQMAQRYLTELGREDMIPAKAKEADFQALSEFAQWLAHPNELGETPDELEVLDRRELAWPPEREAKPFWLIRYKLYDKSGLKEDDEDCGLVGSVTWCFFHFQFMQRPPEDAYAIHCYWEMQQQKLIEQTRLEENPDEYRDLLKQWSGHPLQDATLLYISELSPELRYPQRLVGLASARVNNKEGWVVLDGPRSTWYPREEMPEDGSESAILMLHVGRHVLGFTGTPDRQRFLRPKAIPKSDEQIIASYQCLLQNASKLEGKKRERAFDSFGPLGTHFEKYTEALIHVSRASEVQSLIELFAPYWDHNSGYGILGAAAYKCGELNLAEQFFLKLRSNYEDVHRSAEMSTLAEIWFARGQLDQAKALLLDCLQKLFAEAREAEGSDRKLFEEWFQNHRRTFLKLFAPDAERLLAERHIPATTLV
jgi:hypothetical protein